MSKQNVNSSNKSRTKRRQPKKDSREKRVNYDNAREDKFEKDAKFKDPGKTRASNDVVWYANNPELLRAAASVPFSTTTGLKLPWSATCNGTVPGVMALYWIPSIGGSFNTPINAAAQSTYSYVVHANSRNKSYDAPDLMQIILCGSSLFSMVALGIRTYGLMRTFDQRNRYLPKALVQASGFDYDDLVKNLSRMWFDLNEVIARIQQIWIPNDFPFLARWFWMNTNVYVDANTIKGQFYMFVPFYYLCFAETGSWDSNNHIADAELKGWIQYTNTGTVQAPSFQPLYKTWDAYMSAINLMINRLLEAQDRGIIMGDILKAYGPEKIFTINPITSDYRVEPVYDPEVLSQIENASISPFVYQAISQDPKTNDLYTRVYAPETQQVQYNFSLVTPGAIWTKQNPAPLNQVLNFHQMEPPTPEQVMVATRLKSAGMAGLPNGKGTSTYKGSTAGGAGPLTCGTEYIADISIFMYGGNDTDENTIRRRSLPFNYPYTSDNRFDAEFMFEWTSFDWAPWIYACSWKATWDNSTATTPISNQAMEENQSKVIQAIGEYDYYTILDYQTLEKMHQTAIYSEFGVPTF